EASTVRAAVTFGASPGGGVAGFDFATACAWVTSSSPVPALGLSAEDIEAATVPNPNQKSSAALRPVNNRASHENHSCVRRGESGPAVPCGFRGGMPRRLQDVRAAA